MKKPRKLYRYIITDNASGNQQEVDNVAFTMRYDCEIEIHIEGGDTLTYNAEAVTIRKT